MRADALHWRTGKIPFNAGTYNKVRRDLGLDRHQVDGALDDLFAIGAIDITVGDNCRPRYLQQFVMVLEGE